MLRDREKEREKEWVREGVSERGSERERRDRERLFECKKGAKLNILYKTN